MSSDYVISVENVSKCYEMYSRPLDRLKQMFSFRDKKYYKEFWAVRNISLEIKKGEVVGILGRNGSGKSTLLQMIAGTLQPTSGTIKTEGVLAALLELGSGFNPDFTGHENIYLNGTILGLTKKEIDSKYDEIVSFADIGEHLFQPVKTYSSGMVVRLAFAVQACIRPEILIVDEALSVGDEKFQRKCFEYIEKLKDDGCSILLVTHSTSTVEKFCQRGILMHQGVMHAEGAAKDIVDQYHALLYTDQKEYYKRLLLQKEEQKEQTQEKKVQQDSGDLNIKEVPVERRAEIVGVSVLSEDGTNMDYFQTGEKTLIEIDVIVNQKIPEIQAGILLRTVEGVSAYGTSTMYFNSNIENVVQGERLTIRFALNLYLSPGTYFLTTSIAEAISDGDMLYLDRKTDSAVVKVDQIKSHSNGIAYLPTNITITRI